MIESSCITPTKNVNYFKMSIELKLSANIIHILKPTVINTVGMYEDKVMKKAKVQI